MFKRIVSDADQYVEVTIDGTATEVPAGVSVSTALLLADRTPYRRSPVTEEPRSPHCMIGTCFECLVEINGAPNVQGCLVAVRENMEIRRQLERPSVIPESGDE